jgi:eukaryotic-like serine/threonine-protein kinase
MMAVDPVGATIPAPPASRALSPGEVVGDRYRVEERIGEGRMGIVYRVEHVHMHKSFALKVLANDWAGTPDAFARFEREAVAAGNIASPHVVQGTDFGRLADGSLFLVLEYVQGRTLRSELQGRALPPERALRIARGIVAATAAAHANGVIHRDLKPENIMLVERDGAPDFVKVLDFGLAKVESRDAAGPSSQVLTRLGAIMGTPGYMAPEQAVGERVDARADLYSIGIVLFEMLTGDRPFAGDPVSVLRRHVLEEVPALPAAVRDAIGPRVEQLLRRLLAKSPGDRVESAAALGIELDACLAAPSVHAPVTMYQVPAVAMPEPPPVTVREPRAVKVHEPPPAAVRVPTVVAARQPVSAAVAPGTSPLALLSDLWNRLRAAWPQRRARGGFAWWTAIVDRVRARRRRRRLRALLAAPMEYAGRLRPWLARRGVKLTDRQWTLAVALTTALVLLAIVLLFL